MIWENLEQKKYEIANVSNKMFLPTGVEYLYLHKFNDRLSRDSFWEKFKWKRYFLSQVNVIPNRFS